MYYQNPKLNKNNNKPRIIFDLLVKQFTILFDLLGLMENLKNFNFKKLKKFFDERIINNIPKHIDVNSYNNNL